MVIQKILLIILILGFIYIILVRPWIFRMGADQPEVVAPMPGDGWVINPNMKYTQAITINAPRELVWAYLVQSGWHRGGWYNWDFINRMADQSYFYEGNHSAERIIPELQDLREGDQLYLTPQLGMNVEELHPRKNLILTGRDKQHYLVVWSFLLKEMGNDQTRLLVRWTSNQNESTALKLLNFFIIEPGGAGIQQSQMLRGIKRRAERDYQQRVEF